MKFMMVVTGLLLMGCGNGIAVVSYDCLCRPGILRCTSDDAGVVAQTCDRDCLGWTNQPCPMGQICRAISGVVACTSP